MNVTNRIYSESEFLAELLVDPGLLYKQPKLEVGKKALEIYESFESNPMSINFGQIQDLTLSPGSQIGFPGDYLKHVSNTAGLFRSLVLFLDKKKMQLDLPHPDTAYAMGLVHDLNATFSDYVKGGQQSKEFDEFVLAQRFGWKRMAEQVAMHSVYLETIKLMAEGENFPKEEAYLKMKEVLRGDGSLSISNILSKFSEYMLGKENLPLMLLTFSDYMATDTPFFNPTKIESDFAARSSDIMFRYYSKATQEGKTPSLVGQALVKGGLDRITNYKRIIGYLINDEKETEKLRAETRLFR